ncbi:MAG: hypothetical protein H0X29_04045 [Parachlamydiaceae bacterium]|nr:hypothetical protein [Parachlamydiaceae bacterium]
MSTLLLTLGLAFIIVIIAIACLSLSWLVKGKSSLRPGACGRDPNKKRDIECDAEKTNCHLCKRPDEKEKK